MLGNLPQGVVLPAAPTLPLVVRPHRDSVPLAQATGLRRKPRNRCGTKTTERSEGGFVPNRRQLEPDNLLASAGRRTPSRGLNSCRAWQKVAT